MQREGLTRLEEQLRDRPPAGLHQLEEEHLTHLAAAIRSTRRRQGEQLEAASDHALNHIPRLLRGPVKKIVG
jgi:hypothetical protein